MKKVELKRKSVQPFRANIEVTEINLIAIYKILDTGKLKI